MRLSLASQRCCAGHASALPLRPLPPCPRFLYIPGAACSRLHLRWCSRVAPSRRRCRCRRRTDLAPWSIGPAQLRTTTARTSTRARPGALRTQHSAAACALVCAAMPLPEPRRRCIAAASHTPLFLSCALLPLRPAALTSTTSTARCGSACCVARGSRTISGRSSGRGRSSGGSNAPVVPVAPLGCPDAGPGIISSRKTRCQPLFLVSTAALARLHACLLQISKSVPLKRKEVEPVLGGEEEWKNAPRTEGEADFF